MSSLVTLISSSRAPATCPDLPVGYSMRPLQPTDAMELGRLYFEAYPPGAAADSLEAATADVLASLGGAYGDLWWEASPVATHGSDLAAAVMTVHRGAWEGTPGCPFVIEVFTDRGHRRRGLARSLLIASLRTVQAAGEPSVALRVDPSNTPALQLYESLGFVPWS